MLLPFTSKQNQTTPFSWTLPFLHHSQTYRVTQIQHFEHLLSLTLLFHPNTHSLGSVLQPDCCNSLMGVSPVSLIGLSFLIHPAFVWLISYKGWHSLSLVHLAGSTSQHSPFFSLPQPLHSSSRKFLVSFYESCLITTFAILPREHQASSYSACPMATTGGCSWVQCP